MLNGECGKSAPVSNAEDFPYVISHFVMLSVNSRIVCSGSAKYDPRNNTNSHEPQKLPLGRTQLSAVTKMANEK